MVAVLTPGCEQNTGFSQGRKPMVERLSGELWPEVGSDRLGVTTETSCLIEYPRYILPRNPEGCDQINRLFAEIINDGQYLDPPTIG